MGEVCEAYAASTSFSTSSAASASGSGTARVVAAGAELPSFFHAAMVSSLSWPVTNPACPLMQTKRESTPLAIMHAPIKVNACLVSNCLKPNPKHTAPVFPPAPTICSTKVNRYSVSTNMNNCISLQKTLFHLHRRWIL